MIAQDFSLQRLPETDLVVTKTSFAESRVSETTVALAENSCNQASYISSQVAGGVVRVLWSSTCLPFDQLHLETIP